MESYSDTDSGAGIITPLIHMSGNQIGKSSSEEFALPNDTSANLYHSVCFQIRKVANKNQFKETDDQNATARSFFCRSKRTSSHITSGKYRNRDRGPAHASVIELNFLRDVITAIMTLPLYQSRGKKRKKERDRERKSIPEELALSPYENSAEHHACTPHPSF